MAKPIVTKKPKTAKSVLTNRQLAVFREIIYIGNKMADFLNNYPLKLMHDGSIKDAKELAEE